jgi:uncharacterized membrane protein YphA (DoxX/SURF4 family)
MSTVADLVRRRPASVFHLACRVVLGGLLLWAGATKIGQEQSMVLAIDSYDILPEAAVRPVAAALPWLEITLGVFLTLGLFVRFSAVAAGILFLAFLIGMAQAKARGLAVDCGCFGVGGPRTGVSWLAILRDVALLGMAAFVAAVPNGRWSLDARLKLRRTEEG